MMPERHNTVKVLMLLDVGGSMDDHIVRVQELFSAARSEFRHLDVYYFHNCPYESLWQNNRRRYAERFDTWDILRKYNDDRSEEHTSELQSLMRISYAVFCLKKKKINNNTTNTQYK